jgi:hypothetical protein
MRPPALTRRAGLALSAGWAALTMVSGCASGPPALRAGLWDVHLQSVEKPGDKHGDFSYQLCRDHAYDKAADARLKNVPGCTTVVKDLGGGSYASASNCTVAGITIVSNATSTFKRDGSTHSESHATYAPAFNGKTEETMTQDQHFAGKCPSDMKPGDTVTADGLVVHHEN